MKVLTGHLTATQKKVVKQMIEGNISCAKSGRADYLITNDNGVYTLKYRIMDRGMIPCLGSPLRLSVYTSTFTI